MTESEYKPLKQLAIVVGGPAGTGKTTLGEKLASLLNVKFVEGDALHPKENIDKMAKGIPLTDDDRWGWLADVAQTVSKLAVENQAAPAAVGSCSSLTKTYREYLTSKAQEVSEEINYVTVFLWAPEEVLFERVMARKGHYMGASMVKSQVDLMQVPKPEEEPLAIPVLTTNKTPEEILEETLAVLESKNLISKV
ncbi:hypothetical protein TRVA0_029S00716 [Trichomonascus vanleenenianus]|uniref:gluconokinase n=1 Tax=Trichomonascus vanleenenianus TaxID=2268995 RepID=UPI003EC97385